MRILLVVIPLLLAASLAIFPHFWVMVFMLMDYYTPWKLFDSTLYDHYHHFLVDSLPEKSEIPLPEINASDASFENVRKLTKDYSFPLVIRGILSTDAEGIQKWGNKDFWVDNYGQEQVLCGTFSSILENCTIRDFFKAREQHLPFYISGASHIFDKNPQLHDMIDSPQIQAIETTNRTATQMFMGLPGMGSDIHSEIGINLFRQVTGSKKWWLIPPEQSIYLKPSININSISVHTQTKVGKGGEEPSPWLNKLTRYTTIVNSGDILITPPWYWHGILNLGDPKSDIVIGSPVRYGKDKLGTSAAFKNSPFLCLNLYAVFLYKYGLAAMHPNFRFNMQDVIANNRRNRGQQALAPETTTILNSNL